MFELPEKAIKCFEKWSNTTVSVHGYSREYDLILDQSRTKHQHPFCMNFKTTSQGKFCQQIDMNELAQVISNFRNGGIKRCHAGVLEYFMPIFDGSSLQAIIFAGLRQAPKDWQPKVPYLELGENPASSCCSISQLPNACNEDEFVLEGLAQLAARLKQFFDPIRDNVILETQDIPRDALIQYIICRHYQNSEEALNIISKHLSLSKSRTLHVIKEETGKSFMDLINTVRINNACFSLRSSLKPIQVISVENGFGNISNFFRLFKKKLGLTPLAYRKINTRNSTIK